MKRYLDINVYRVENYLPLSGGIARKIKPAFERPDRKTNPSAYVSRAARNRWHAYDDQMKMIGHARTAKQAISLITRT